MMQQSNAALYRPPFFLSASDFALLVASALPPHACGRGEYEDSSFEQKKIAIEKLNAHQMKLEKMRAHHKSNDQEHRGKRCEPNFEGDE